MPDRRISDRATFLALLGVPAVIGALSGLVDAILAVGPGRVANFGLFFHNASLGAVLALGALLPLILALGLFRRPRRPASRLAIVLAGTLLAPLGLLLARALYKRIPWGVGDLLLVAAGIAGALALGALVSAITAGLPRRREAGLVRAVARVAVPALLLATPGAVRLVTAAGPPNSAQVGARGSGNLLLISVDTLRPDRLGVLGDPHARTPWIDRIARRSVVWADCLAPSPWTLPSLGSMLTGTYPGQHLVLEELSGLSASVPTLAEACREDGLRTAAFVSNPWLATGSLSRGFGRFDVAERLECLDPVRGTRLAYYVSKAVLRGASLDSAVRVSTQTAAWIERGEGGWFAWAHYFDPHLPNWPGFPWDRLFGPPPVQVGSALTADQIRSGEFPGGEEGRREIDALYDGEVAFTDWGLGVLWRRLEAGGELERTAVVFSGDHGEELWDHADYGHGHAMYDEVIRVPLFVRPPGGVPGRVEGGFVRLVDLAPTALAVAGVEPLPDRETAGRDLLAASGSPPTYGEAVLYGEEQKFLRKGRWKLVFRPDSPADLLLFDVQADPAERRNRAASNPQTTGALLEELAVWMERVGSAGAMAARDVPDSLDSTIREQLEALGYID